jgi:hypothetical protein
MIIKHSDITGECNAPEDWHLYIPELKGNKCSLYKKLMSKAKLVENHFLWFGATTGGDHGVITIRPNKYLIGRLSLFLVNKLKLNDKLQALHKEAICTYKNCWNPEHLYVGTQSDNMRDAIITGNHFWIKNKKQRKTHCECGKLLNPDRDSRTSVCRDCHKRRCKERNLRASGPQPDHDK